MELQLAMRYYERIGAPSGMSYLYSSIFLGGTAGGQVGFSVPFKVEKRIAPTANSTTISRVTDAGSTSFGSSTFAMGCSVNSGTYLYLSQVVADAEL
jgi:hypothetical protein